MTAPAVTKRPALFLVPLAVGAVVSVALGVYGNVHTPTGHPLFYHPFSSMFAMKVWLTAVALLLALVQLVTALWMYGKLGVRAPGWAGRLHKTTGTLAFLVTLPVAFHCLWALGFQRAEPRLLFHSLLGCFFFGAFTAKVIVVQSKGLPGWWLPVAGGSLFTALVLLWLSSAGWFFVTFGVQYF